MIVGLTRSFEHSRRMLMTVENKRIEKYKMCVDKGAISSFLMALQHSIEYMVT